MNPADYPDDSQPRERYALTIMVMITLLTAAAWLYANRADLPVARAFAAIAAML